MPSGVRAGTPRSFSPLKVKLRQQARGKGWMYRPLFMRLRGSHRVFLSLLAHPSANTHSGELGAVAASAACRLGQPGRTPPTWRSLDAYSHPRPQPIGFFRSPTRHAYTYPWEGRAQTYRSILTRGASAAQGPVLTRPKEGGCPVGRPEERNCVAGAASGGTDRHHPTHLSGDEAPVLGLTVPADPRPPPPIGFFCQRRRTPEHEAVCGPALDSDEA